ncbi:uncharacterized protein LOC125063944 isoform X2 [Vanessa atalanta]|uniref:uncharacterized protein LOC125063944 isoform X2 n=1 Tax=Vanessa atalanta TaxID=42275 RepID=UPI001FCD4839|nr:uncharacterized protein LOC125063944 isoform X2 [Vanessa atalanta]
MGDLYDNLENYNDVNIVDELKCENRELKLKLEEISKAMGKLQKDFDKVNSEYKQLEINYSSLLKTARAEIERKTEMIKDLNFQKDMIVINAMKATGKNVLNVKKGNFNPKEKGKTNNKTLDNVNKQKPNIRVAPASNHHKDNGVDSSYTPSIDTISIKSTGNKSTSSEEKLTKPVGESCEINKNKENYSKDSHKDESLQSSKKVIMNRRKSMQGMSQHEAKFSSDDDAEAKYSTARKSPLRSDLKHNEWCDTRDYRIEPHEYYEPSKEYSRFRTSRYTNYEKFRNVDRHENFQKNRRQYSPERDQQRHINEYNEEYHVRGDYGKQRLSRTNSPSTDKYNRSKSRDRRFNYDRDNYRENDKHSNRYYEHTAVKYRTRHDYDEPCSKRQKMDIHGKSAAEMNIYANNKERELTERNHVSKSQYKLNSSCQSPDHVNVENSGSQHFVKEIMNTAETKLEDPRISSKKYILKTSNDSTILSTVVGRDIDMQFVDKALWGIEKNDVPAVLSKPVFDRENNDLLKEIYMDIDNPELHHTLESGEIDDFNDDIATNYSKEIDKEHDNGKDELSKANTDSETRNLNISKEEVDTKTSLKTKFKIPKIKKPDKMNEKDLAHQEPCDITKKKITDDTSVKNHQHIIQNIELVSDKQYNNKIDIKDNSEPDKAIIDKRTQDIIRTIEGDLELSDEASDIVEFHNDVNKKSNDNSHESKTILNMDKDSNSTIRNENKSDVTSLTPEPISSKKADTPKSVTKDSLKESSKKRKSKRKTIEQKETHSVTLEQHNEKCHNTKKSKGKESKKMVSKQTISKFSDLFGDSSSLITPDDLGLNNMQVQPANKYTSIFDNTQDAVDLSVEDIAKTLTRANKVNAFDSVVDKSQDKKVADFITSNFSVNVTVVDENAENKTEDVQSPLNNVYENTKSETLTDGSNIVKTVIISSGIQPECSAESSTSVATPQIHAPSLAPITNDVILKKCPLNSIKALATSTPQKCIEHVDVAQRDSFCTAPSEDVSASMNMTNSSSLNNTDALQREDIPDVRIFVRRRRKPVRKAT